MLRTKNLVWILIALFFHGCFQMPITYNTEYWRKYYEKQLAPGSRLVSAGPNQTVEYVNGQYLQKKYFFDTKTIISAEYFTDAAMKTPTDKAFFYSDQGVKTAEVFFVNGKIHGETLRYHDETGTISEKTVYQHGLKEGPAYSYYKDGTLLETCNYHLDSLDGELIRYESDGRIRYKEWYKNGTLIEKKGNDGSLMGTQDYELFDIQKIPEFPCDPAFASAAHCGQSSLSAYLSKNIRYPADAREFGIQGTAIVTFVVEKDGSITQLKVVRGWCESIRQECIRVVGGMPRWKPGTANDKPVKVKFTLPIRFRLE